MSPSKPPLLNIPETVSGSESGIFRKHSDVSTYPVVHRPNKQNMILVYIDPSFYIVHVSIKDMWNTSLALLCFQYIFEHQGTLESLRRAPFVSSSSAKINRFQSDRSLLPAHVPTSFHQFWKTT